MLGECFNEVRKKAPLIHNITNYVTVNDVANMLLACGASPIMADEPEDAQAITEICGGLNINIGTLNKRTITAMFTAGRQAQELGHVLVLDPVGAGASPLRTETALKLMQDLKFDVIRGNISEIKTLALGNGTTKGVDADAADAVTEGTLYGQVEQALKGGATFVQLREKHLDTETFLAEAREIKELCRSYHVPFVVNDSVDVALAVDTDGVHVGQGDMEAGSVREKLGPGKIIGVSAQTVGQAPETRGSGGGGMMKGAIFDVDGVLLDSMGVWEDLGERYIRSLGLSPEEGLSGILFPMSLPETCLSIMC